MKPIVLDVDTGFDDGVALLYAAASPDLELSGATVCHGNAALSVTLPNTRRVLHAGGFPEVPVLAGADRPLGRDLAPVEDIQDWRMEFEGPGEATEPTHAVDWLIDWIRRAPEPVTLVPVAPLTNIALAFEKAPDIKERIDRMVIMGGALQGGNTNAVAEFNIYADPEAARAVFLAGVPITMVGLDVTRQALIGAPEVERIRGAGTKAAHLAADLIEEALRRAAGRGADSVQVYDACAVAAVIEPSILETVALYVDVETRGELTLGQTVCDTHNRLRQAPNVDVAVRIDSEWFMELMVSGLAGRSARS
jgi:purine nucleosidase